MTDTSTIDQVVDATAAIAAAYVPGIHAAFGVGSGKVTVPAGGILAGKLIQPWKGSPTESWEHVSNTPSATAIYRTATVTEVNWDVPMRLYFSAADEVEFRRRMLGYYEGYLTAFSQHLALLGVTRGVVSRMTFAVGGDGTWSWLELHLPLVERLNLENKA